MQHILQKGLKSGMSATSGIHSSRPEPLPKGFEWSRDLTPASFVPGPVNKDPVVYRGKKSNVVASRMIIGAWPWGDKATFHWDPSEEPNVADAWQIYLRDGVNMIDTAQVYGDGESERITGRLVAGLPRDSFVIQTKWWVFPGDPKNVIAPKDAPYKKLKESLERLKLSFVDIYLVHGPIHHQDIPTVAKAMAECVNDGLTKAVGVANYDEAEMLAMRDELDKYGVPLALNQCEYNLLRREDEVTGLMQVCKKNDIVFQAYSSLAQGRLSGKYDSRNPPPKSYKFSSYPMEYVEPTLDVLKRIAAARRVSVAAVALNYNMVHGACPLVGTRDPKMADENSQALGWRLTDEEIHALDAVSYKGRRTSLWQRG